MRGDAGEGGFTLIELLVGLVILGLTATMLFAGIAMAAQMTARARSSGDALDGVTAVQGVLRERLSTIRPSVRTGSLDGVIAASGDGKSFEFVGAAADRDAPDAPMHYRLILLGGGRLVLYRQSTLAPITEDAGAQMTGWTPDMLLDGVATMTIDYYGDDRLSGRRRWQRYWGEHPQLPDLVRIRATFPAGDPRVWPDLVVRPRATINGACAIDRLTGRCGEPA